MSPVVSVVMSVYNGDRFLGKAINSILSQTFRDFEFLIMDDGSTDRTGIILKEFEKKDKRIEILSQSNQGLALSLNTLIGRARGKYVARMDADDISTPERLELQVRYMRKNPEHALVTGGCLIIDNDEVAINGKLLRDDSSKLKEIIFSGKRNPFTHGLLMFNKDYLDKLSMVYRFRYSQDFDLLLRLASQYPVGAIDKILYFYREGSALQGDYFLLKKRLEQRAFLSNLSKDKLFDDKFCIFHVGEIYKKNETKRIPFCDSQDFQFDLKQRQLKKFFILGHNRALRKKTKKLILEYGLNKNLISYYILSFFPVNFGYILQHVIVKMKNYTKDQTIHDMTIREILQHSKTLFIIK